MTLIVPLPASVRALLGENTHPGLMLDKYVPSWDPDAPPGKLSERVQRPAVDAVAALSQGPPPGFPFDEVKARWHQVLRHLHAKTLTATSRSPFTLHLARASALENAGICLHPLYGFVYLPGSGVKGMAHAYACEVWLPAENNRQDAWNTICKVFGWAPSRWLDDLARRLGVQAPKESCSGAVVFHDAWPDAWPRLTVDILNNHHSHYYQKGEPPGDWDSPMPVYFLSVPAGQRFTFAVSPRREDAPSAYLDLAVTCLAGALEQIGAGAKTASGYGDFAVAEVAPSAAPPRSHSAQATLELVTPGFFAGANQEQEADCLLRPASLRGMLRWWWRTMHAGYVDPPTLARLEAAVWGDVQSGSALRLTLEPVGEGRRVRFDKEQARRDNRLPPPPNNKTTQGLSYHSFGMDDKKGESRRWYLLPDARWQVLFRAREGRFKPVAAKEEGRSVPADVVLEQARAALWLLCRFGGLGAKCRKGFGSFADPKELEDIDLAHCKEQAARFREACGLGKSGFDLRRAGSPSLEQALWLEIPANWGANVWLALDLVGSSAQRFAQLHKHRLEKRALGLPRKKDHPQGKFHPGRHVEDRHASPVWYHLTRGPGGLVLRVTAFPACELPSLDESRAFLQQLLDHLRQDLPERFARHAAAGRASPQPPPTSGRSSPTLAGPAPSVPRAGDRVEAELLAEKTKNGGWKARHPATGLSGPIVNTADVPADKTPGDKVTLIAYSISGQVMSFRWPTAADLAAPPKTGAAPRNPKPGRRR